MLFDLIVLGTDSAGWEAAMLAVDLDQSVAVLNDPDVFEAAETNKRREFPSSKIGYFSGSIKFAGWDSLEIQNSQGIQSFPAKRILLACGTRPKRPPHIPFDGQRILSSDDRLRTADVPQTALVVGTGEHGLKAAAELLKQGVRVSLVDQSTPVEPKNLTHQGRAYWELVQKARCPVQWNTAVLGVENRKAASMVYFENGSIESYGAVVFAVGRLGCTDQLCLPRPDLLLDERFRIWCNERGQTWLPHVFAAGSVIGFPRFPGTAFEEAEHVLRHMLFEEPLPRPHAFLTPPRRMRAMSLG